jgi:hypothetical protein
MNAREEALLKALVAPFREQGVSGFGVSRLEFGGIRTRYLIWRAIENMAELDGPGILTVALEMMGEESAAEWNEENSQVLASPAQFDIYVYQEDLNYYPEQ